MFHKHQILFLVYKGLIILDVVISSLLQNLSTLFLKLFNLCAVTTSYDKLFQSVITR